MAAITVTIPDALVATYERFQGEQGQGWAGAYLTEKLKELVGRHQATDAKDAKGRLDTLTAEETMQIPPSVRAKLKL